MVSRLAASLLVLATVSTVFPASGQSNGSRALEGAWEVKVTPNPGGPPNLSAFETLITYVNGTTIEYNGQPAFSPAMGEWSYAGKGTFDVTWLKPIHNPQGQRLGTVKVRSKIQMVSPNEYTSQDQAETFTPDGTRVAAWTASSRGKRIVVEPVE
jgi:hypothetical protein